MYCSDAHEPTGEPDITTTAKVMICPVMKVFAPVAVKDCGETALHVTPVSPDTATPPIVIVSRIEPIAFGPMDVMSPVIVPENGATHVKILPIIAVALPGVHENAPVNGLAAINADRALISVCAAAKFPRIGADADADPCAGIAGLTVET